MMILSGAGTLSSCQLPLYSAGFTISSGLCNHRHISLSKLISYPLLREKSFGVAVVGDDSKPRTCLIHPDQISLLTAHVGNWEDPDDSDYGNWEERDDSDIGSDNEEEEEEKEGMEENNLDFESDWEEQVDASPTLVNVELSTSQFNEALEVEQLLTPEERAILHQNENPDLDKISTEKWNLLHTLALAGDIKFMDILLANGFDIDLVDKDGQTALHKAIIGKKEAVISHLLRKGASPHVRDVDGATPLHYAVQVSAMQTVKLLIKYNVDVNAADDEGWTPLHIAMQSRNRDIAKVLLVNGADKNRRTKDGQTPLDLSLCYGKEFKSYDLAKLLKVVPASSYR